MTISFQKIGRFVCLRLVNVAYTMKVRLDYGTGLNNIMALPGFTVITVLASFAM